MSEAHVNTKAQIFIMDAVLYLKVCVGTSERKHENKN